MVTEIRKRSYKSFTSYWFEAPLRTIFLFIVFIGGMLSSQISCLPKQWATVVQLSGKDSKHSKIFELKTGDVKLVYDVYFSRESTFRPEGNVTIFLIKEEELRKMVRKEIAPPKVSDARITEPGRDEIFLSKSPGRYIMYVFPNSSVVQWGVKIEERR